VKDEDMSKVKLFACGKMGHYVVQCPNKKGKKKKDVVASTEVDEFTSRFYIEFASSTKVDEFALVVSLATRVTSSRVWFVDSGAF